MEGTIYSLIPAILMLILVIATRRVILSLGIGIIVGALLLYQFNFMDTVAAIWTMFYEIFIADASSLLSLEGWNMGNIYLFLFLIFLGIATAFMTASGGSKAFGEWAINRIKTRRGAQAVPAYLGIIIFIDDYFNALAVGQVSRPLTDRYKISRAKLAYFIDSTSAPVTVISPISSWGAYIIGTIGSILVANEISDYQPLEAFVKMIPANFYVFAALLLVFMAAYMKLDIGPMRKHEKRALETGELTDPSRGDIPGDLNDEFKSHTNGRIYHLLVPIAVLILGTVSAMVVTGIQNTDGSATLLSIFENTDVNISLFTGGLLSVIGAALLYVSQPGPKSKITNVLWEGTKAMLPAIYILVFAWMIGTVIDQLGTGEYLANLVEQASISPAFLPFLIFLVSGFMALGTGTSWGTFGIMLPIAGEIAAVTDVSLVLPALSAVLAGAVFGDHCSPISDTTILSSTGAGSNHIDHVLTQLPYAMIAATAAGIGYLVLGFSGQVLLPLILTLVIVAAIGLLIHLFSPAIQVNKQ
ncbi:tetracycline efflux Na+/H+ antiporter family transporter Tet(35) [Thalassobacillus devorans]|uniref:Tetracycline efflux Na+/H+ antiporter family transporter Tet(35) n=1 Tax=Thalassobacillus devorans TaxID=279813 RepID=A0ABQ1NNK5_9BACI|nr:Na+/H+ antiporter NhaC family protein [Thalassobacillus devorans]NIK29048.1 Na+/H+ antiporter NhaC [Thalassobacillus devorans]GGC81542.1 tetracycline efflux Na+/H+ antiporter family transporter Tet(35) [Thalassobacillus devorans]